MELLYKWLNKIDYFFVIISAGTIFLMMLWIFLDVILRYFFNSPITGTMELTGEYFMVFIVYLAISYTHKLKGHVNVDLFLRKFPKGIKKITSLLSNLIVLFMFTLLGINNFNRGLEAFNSNTTSVGLLEYPLGPAYMVITIGMLALSIRILFESILILQNKQEY